MKFYNHGRIIVFSLMCALALSSCQKEYQREGDAIINFEPAEEFSNFYYHVFTNGREENLDAVGYYCTETENPNSELNGYVISGEELYVDHQNNKETLSIGKEGFLAYMIEWSINENELALGKKIKGIYYPLNLFDLTALGQFETDWYVENSEVEIEYTELHDKYLKGNFSGYYINEVDGERFEVDGEFVLENISRILCN